MGTLGIVGDKMSDQSELRFTPVGYERFRHVGLESTLSELATPGIVYVIGNSANIHRQRFARELAGDLGAEYIHSTSHARNIDELDAKTYLRHIKNGFKDLLGVTKYQALTVVTKFCRLLGLEDHELDGIGLYGQLDRSIVLLSDTINILQNGKQMEKPTSIANAKKQINLITEGAPYVVSNVQLVIWGTWSRGAAINMHHIPVRFDPKLDPKQRLSIRRRWIEMYESGEYPKTPGAVSQTEPEIFYHMQVKKDNKRGLTGYFTPWYAPTPMTSLDEWVHIKDLVPGLVDLIGTTISGSSSIGYIAALERLAQTDINHHSSDRQQFVRMLTTAMRMIDMGRSSMPKLEPGIMAGD